MLRLRDLNYKMTGTGDHNELSFDCPVCGPPYRICIHARLNGPASDGVWAWTIADPTDMESISVTPSINNHNHGRKKSCSFHGNIAAGEVVTA